MGYVYIVANVNNLISAMAKVGTLGRTCMCCKSTNVKYLIVQTNSGKNNGIATLEILYFI